MFWQPFDATPKYPKGKDGKGPRILVKCDRGEAVICFQKLDKP